jgi:hypothetical protein
MAFAMFRDEETGTLSATGMYRTDSAEEALEAMVEQSTLNVALAEVWLSMVGAGEMTQELSEETIEGVNVKVMAYPLGLLGGDPEMVRMMRAIYGDALVVRMAAKEDKLYFTLGAKGNMERLLSGTNVTLAPEKVARSLDSLTGEPSVVFLYSVPDTMVMGMSFAGAMMPGGQAPMIQAPPTSRLLAGAVSFEGPTARFEMSLPTEQINAAKMVMMQMMMQMQQQQQPGAPGGPGAPPWQPEAPPQ